MASQPSPFDPLDRLEPGEDRFVIREGVPLVPPRIVVRNAPLKPVQSPRRRPVMGDKAHTSEADLRKLRRQKERIDAERLLAPHRLSNEIAANLLRREIREAGEEPCA